MHDCVLLESTTLLQRRLGLRTAVQFNRDAQAFETVWVDATLYQEAVDLLTAIDNRQVSLVDCMSFVVMRRHALEQALAYDVHFERQGFKSW